MPQTAFAGKIAAFYLEPHLGAARVILRAVEIERSFVSSVAQEEVSYDWSDINPDGAVASVGRMISYKGSGLEMGWTTGLKISGLKLGFTFSWLNVTFSGYSKRYRYSPELMRAQGRKYWDTDTVPVFRLLGSVKYGVPIWRRMLVNFQTRIGSMVVKNTALVVGRAVEENNGLTADVGIEFTLRPNKWLSVGVLGYGGLFAFAGKYEGGMGVLLGGNGVFCLYF
ncbi:MAG: hypothetical protein JXX29_05710 [Deltaproteobacteria bacterium]|nr:hypothetical protein [Deltaproteobacteria bacterium]